MNTNMKKTMMMAMMAVAATSAFAQDALVKEAKKHLSKSEFDQAAQVLAPALTSAETLDKAAAWNLQCEIMQTKFATIQEASIKSNVDHQAYDTVGMHRAAVAAMEAALKCDEFDRQPNEKGKVKIRFRTANQQKMQNTRLALINAGLYEYNHKNMDAAFADWSLYLNSAQDEFFTGIDMTKDPYRSEIAYYAGLVAYQKHDYVNAEKYATMAAEDPAKAGEANEIMLFSKKENLKTKEDSVSYVAMLKDLHAKEPSEQRYFNLLMDYYTRANDLKALKAWAQEEIGINAENKMAWALVGEVQMNDREWDAAVESYKKAIELDPEFVQCVFNAGVCLSTKAIDLKDLLADKQTGKLTNANADKVKAILAEAKTFMERVQELDPGQSKVKWLYPLYQIYYNLGDSRAADLEKQLGNN